MQNISFTEQILYHAKRSETHESCGFVVSKGGELRYFPCENVAVDLINHFEISPDDWIRAESVGEIVAVVHSHPDSDTEKGLPYLSTADRECQVRLNLPFWLVCDGKLQKFRPIAPLVGRQFENNKQDCRNILLDAYMLSGLDLPDDVEYEFEWFKSGNLYEENLLRFGFERLDFEAQPQLGDIVLLQIGSDVANHAGIYLGNQMMLHHSEGRLSARVPFYDLVTNKLAGLGQRLGDYGIDKFQLYQIAQYCDQQVPDGYGGVEPRMVANLWLTEQRDAYSVISDMASVFRAIVMWNGTQLTAIQDRNADPVCSFTQANVIDGKFNRQYVPLKSIFTAVEVEYADERNNYQKAIEYVADDAMIKRYGYNVKKIVAFACTSRGQARRYGKWVLETSRLEQCTISFSVGREGLQVRA
ncbi:phage tail protein, partial [Glaesserella parasuis]|uniref:phage tail protein n=2 Tax=Glaesserella parasuis TaxID=738 RepID=UPI002436941C